MKNHNFKYQHQLLVTQALRLSMQLLLWNSVQITQQYETKGY